MTEQKKLAAFTMGLVLTLIASIGHARVQPPGLVDLTKDGNAESMLAQEGVLNRTYNLGPTGLRGWIYSTMGVTDKARQILVTLVDTNSPADGVVQVGDVILGVDGKAFESDARMCFALAIGSAESEERQGVLNLLVWRGGNERTLELKLKTMGTYSDTAPYDCPKSARIFEEGCRHIVRNGNRWGRFNLEGLILLASGKKEYLEIVREKASEMASSKGTADFVKRVAESDEPIGTAWNGGYGGLFWSEYYLATGDKRVLPWVRANAINTARGQGMWGTYGHGFSARTPDGALHGIIPPYGALNQAGLGCFLTMVLAEKAGVKHEELDAALKRSNKFFQYYTGKGTIPYGEHRPEVWRAHDNNGTSGLAAYAFALQGKRRDEARFWAKMMTAGYQGLEHGHAGPFFSFLWGTPGASVGGPSAAAAYFKEIAWHYDLERRWDGSFAYTQAGGTNLKWGMDNRGISGTGAYLLTFALPMRQLFMTGKNPDKKIWLNKREVAEAIESGRFGHATRSVDELLTSLGSWSPAERVTAAEELAKREQDMLPRIVAMAEGKNINAMVGACHALAKLKERAVPALPVLIRLLGHEDQWVRVQAAEALKSLGEVARPAVPAMLKAVAVTDESDPLRFGQGSLCYALFYPGGSVAGSAGLLAKSIEGIDKELLYPAIRAVSVHPDGHARGCLRSTYELLTLEDVKALMPEIVASITDMAPCNTMFSKGAMLAGVKMLGRLHVAEGVPLAMEMYKWSYHGRGYVVQYIGGVIKQYGGAARSLLPELKEIQAAKAAQYPGIDEIIAAIENDPNPLTLISLNDYAGRYKDRYKVSER